MAIVPDIALANQLPGSQTTLVGEQMPNFYYIILSPFVKYGEDPKLLSLGVKNLGQRPPDTTSGNRSDGLR